MPERAILREHFAGLYTSAREAAEQYRSLADTAADPARKEQLERLARDGRRHIELAERLLDILSE